MHTSIAFEYGVSGRWAVAFISGLGGARQELTAPSHVHRGAISCYVCPCSGYYAVVWIGAGVLAWMAPLRALEWMARLVPMPIVAPALLSACQPFFSLHCCSLFSIYDIGATELRCVRTAWAEEAHGDEETAQQAAHEQQAHCQETGATTAVTGGAGPIDTCRSGGARHKQAAACVSSRDWSSPWPWQRSGLRLAGRRQCTASSGR